MPYQDDVLFLLAVEPSRKNKSQLEAFARDIRETMKRIARETASAMDESFASMHSKARTYAKASAGSGGYANMASSGSYSSMGGSGFSSATRGANAAAQAMNETDRAVRKATKSVEEHVQETKKISNAYQTVASSVNNSMRNLHKTINSYVMGYFAISTVKEFVGGVLDASFQMDRAMARMKVFTGSTEAARQNLMELKSLSSLSGMSFGSLTRGASTLMSYGVGASQTQSAMRSIATITNGDTQALNRMAVAYGQVMAAGRLYKQEVNQMVNAGFNPLTQIAKDLGVEMKDLKDLMRDGAISADIFAKAMENATKKGGMFGGMLEEVAATSAGRFSSLTAEWEQFMIALGQSNNGKIMGALTDLSTALAGVRIAMRGESNDPNNPTTNKRSSQIKQQIADLQLLERAFEDGGLSAFGATIGSAWKEFRGTSWKDLLTGSTKDIEPEMVRIKRELANLQYALEDAEGVESIRENAKKSEDAKKRNEDRVKDMYKGQGDELYAKMIDAQYGDNANRVKMLREQSLDLERNKVNELIKQGASVDRILQSVNATARAEDQGLMITMKRTAELEKQKESQKKIGDYAEKLYKAREDQQKKLNSAAESFADLSLVDKQLAIRAKQKADSQGFSALNRSEREVLSKIGTTDAEKVVQDSRLREADRFGFNRIFGSSENRAIQQADAQLKRLDLNTQLELKTKIAIDGKEAVQAIVGELQKFQSQLPALVQSEMNKQKQNNQFQQTRNNMERRNAGG